MTARGYTAIGRTKYTKTALIEKKVVTFEATVSTDDTIPISEFTGVASAHIAKKSDGSEVTCTVATNIITVTGAALTDVPVVGSAYET
jgi:hypothetical protein